MSDDISMPDLEDNADNPPPKRHFSGTKASPLETNPLEPSQIFTQKWNASEKSIHTLVSLFEEYDVSSVR